MWLIFAILSSLFASLMTIFMKVGLKNLDSTLVTGLRTSMVFILLWILILFMNKGKNIKDISPKGMEVYCFGIFCNILYMGFLFSGP